MHIQRLTLLAAELQTNVPKRKFDLLSWRSDDLSETIGVSDESLLHSCGTTACAVGWACAMPEFKAEGLHFEGTLPMWDKVVTDAVGYHRAWASIEQFFGLDEITAQWLFMLSGYEDEEGESLPGLEFNGSQTVVHPEHVAHRIRHLLAGDSMSSHTFEGFAA